MSDTSARPEHDMESGREQPDSARGKYELLFIMIATLGGGLAATMLSMRPVRVYMAGFVAGSVAYALVFFVHHSGGTLGEADCDG